MHLLKLTVGTIFNARHATRIHSVSFHLPCSTTPPAEEPRQAPCLCPAMRPVNVTCLLYVTSATSRGNPLKQLVNFPIRKPGAGGPGPVPPQHREAEEPNANTRYQDRATRRQASPTSEGSLSLGIGYWMLNGVHHRLGFYYCQIHARCCQESAIPTVPSDIFI